MARAGLDVRVKLAPLEDLPEEPFEVLVVPPELELEASRPGVQVLATSPTEALKTIEHLLRDLESGAELTAETLDPNAPRLERYRGFLPL